MPALCQANIIQSLAESLKITLHPAASHWDSIILVAFKVCQPPAGRRSSVFHFCSSGLQERTFKSEPMVEQLMVHYSTDGFLLHRSSEEARRQLEAEKAADDAANRFQAEVGS